MEFLNALNNTPIPTILVLAGIFFVALPIVIQIGGKIELSGRPQKTSIAAGLILFFFGVSLYWIAAVGNIFSTTSPPTVIGVIIRESHEGGELVYYQEVNFYDDDGNTHTVEWNLIDLSDPSQRQYVQLQNSVTDTLPQVQKIRATATGTWRCEGHIYVATIEVTLLDRDGNRSEPVRYTIDCK